MTTLIPKYDQGASGASNRPINLKLGEWVSVKDFGATGDGVTDDTVAFTNALAASNYVYIPAGTYMVQGNFSIAGKAVFGDYNASSIIKLLSAYSTNCIFNNIPAGVSQATWAANTTWGAYPGFYVANLGLQGQGAGSTPVPAPANWVDMPGLIWSSHGTQITVENCHFNEYAGHGISMLGAGYTNIDNCFFEYLSGNGVTLQGTNVYTDAVTSTNITNSGFRQITGNSAIDCYACFAILIQGNTIESSPTGVRFTGTAGANTLCRSLRVLSNYIETSTYGLLSSTSSADATYLTLAFNEADKLGQYGSGGVNSIQDFVPVTAFDNTAGNIGWVYRSTGISSAQNLLLNPASTVDSLKITDAFGTEAVRFFKGGQGITGGYNVADAFQYINKDSTTSRSINAAGTINASGADYAEYMTKASADININKGDICGIDANGKLTNLFNDAISFVVKSTSPSYVGNDTWGADLKTADELEIARKLVDRIAFSGQVPVNVKNAKVGQFIVPVNNNGAIGGQAISNPTYEEYQIAVGKVISVNSNGNPIIIVKIA